VLVLAVVALEVPLASSVADRIDAEVRSQARGQADVVAASVADLLGPGDARERERLVDAAAASVRGRVIVVDARGDLLADSEGTPPGRSYAGRPEIAAALEGSADQRERSSQTLGQTLLVTSVPVLSGGRAAGAVRVSQSVEAVDRAVRRAWIGLALIGLLVLGLGLLAGSVVAGQIARPIRRLDRAARRVAEGELSTRAAVEGSAEQQSLAGTFNDMTARLERLVRSQRDFVADASHQLRTPLTGLRLRVEAARGESREPAVDEELDAALEELDRLALMIDELLQLSRAGERTTAGERLALPELATRGAALDRRRGRARPAAHGDRGRRRRGLAEPGGRRPHPRRARGERARLLARQAARSRSPRWPAGSRSATAARGWRRARRRACSSASTAAAPRARARQGRGSDCRSRASWRGSGAAT
jgi:signal transduction histidine kinase